jgi:hypothetical protein
MKPRAASRRIAKVARFNAKASKDVPKVQKAKVVANGTPALK